MFTILALFQFSLLRGLVLQIPASDGTADAFRFERLHYRDRIERDGTQVRDIEVDVHLGTAQGVAQFGQIGLPYVDGFADVLFEDVFIEKPDGRRVDASNGVIDDLNPFGVSGTSLPADVRFKKMTIPGLEPGDRLSYRLSNRQKPLAPGRAFGEMKLPPVTDGLTQTYELDLPRDAQITVRLREGLGASWEEVPSPPDRLVRRLTMTVVGSTFGERSLTQEDVERWVEPDVVFTSFKSWSEVSEWWWNISKDRLLPDDAIAKEAANLAGNATTPREKVSALHTFLAARIRYVNVSFGLGRMQPRPADEVLLNRYGDCKDKHALLAALATSLGVDVRPVLINSVRTELQDDVPSPAQFDHMISVVRLGTDPSEWLWLDATNPFGGLNHLLPQLRDKRALLVEPTGEAVIVRTPKHPPFVPRQDVTLKATLSAEGLLEGRMTWLVRSDSEFHLRALLGSLAQDSRPNAVKELLAKDWLVVENVVFSDPLDVASPFRIEFDVEKVVEAKGGDRALWVPFPEFDLPEAIESVSAEAPAVSFDDRQMSMRAEIGIPEGHRASAPLSLSLERPFGTFRSSYSAEGRVLKLERTLALSQPSLPDSDAASYDSFRNAVQTDRKQEFSIAFTAAVAEGPSGAEDYRREGLAAFSKRDYSKAVELLQKATEINPKVKNGFLDLGLALYELKRDDEAFTAFTRQIEATPFHENAFAWRAFVLQRLERWDEAEKDLAKQIEVAPFEVWSYGALGDRRYQQERYDEASEYYVRAAAIEPKVIKRWLDLAAAQSAAGLQEETRKSLEQALHLEPSDQEKMAVAMMYGEIGDRVRAGDLAESALSWLTGRLSGLSGDTFSEADVDTTARLAKAWRWIGESAAAAGNPEKAKRYLEAAWRLDFQPEAGWALGNLFEAQGQLADAVRFWSMAAATPNADDGLPKDRQTRIEEACKKLPAAESSGASVVDQTAAFGLDDTRPRAQLEAEARLRAMHTLRLEGPVLEQFTDGVLFLANADGVVERVKSVTSDKPELLERQLAELADIRLDWLRPDDRSWRAARRGLLACTSQWGCILSLLPPKSIGDDSGSITITSLDPADGSVLSRGQQVNLTATVRYELRGDRGMVSLVIQDQAGRLLLSEQIPHPLMSKTGEVTLNGAFTVPSDTTQIDVFLPLYARPGGSTRTVAKATYYVK